MLDIPREISLGEIYVPPLLLSALCALLLTLLTSRLLSRWNLYRAFFNPPLVFLSLCILYTALLEYLIWPT